MSTAALAVGVSVTGAVAILIIGFTILFCVLHKSSKGKATSRSTNSQTPRQVVWTSTSKGTEKIKKKAEQLKEKKRKGSCCVPLCCGCSGIVDGPLPAPPWGVEIREPGESEVTILWSAPSTENSSVPIDGYRIHVRFKESPNEWAKVAKVKPFNLEYRLKGLIADKRYVAGVSSKSKTGESTITETATIILKKNPVRPGAPTEFDAIDKTFNSITLSWKPPRKTGYSRILNYHLMIKDFNNNTKWSHVSTLQAFDRYMDYRMTNLKSNNQYRFKVNAENAVGAGPYAETVTIETLSQEPEPPDKPRGPIKYSNISYNSITLSWRPPEQDGGRLISGYAVEYKEKDSVRWSKAGVCEAHINKFTVATLFEDIDFRFRVIAMNDVGNSQPLTGAKVRTKLLEIPLSRRSSFRLPSRDGTARGSVSSGRQSKNSQRMQNHSSMNDVQALDNNMEADPHVPKSDFFTYDETAETGNISTRHQDNRTRHSSSSALPQPPSPKVKKFSRRKRQHYDFSPLPIHSSVRLANGYAYSSGRSGNNVHGYGYGNGDDDENTHGDISNRSNGSNNDNDKINSGRSHTESDNDHLADSRGLQNYPRHQTPSNVAYSYSHKY